MKTASLFPDDLITQLWRHARLWLAEMLRDFTSPAAILRAVTRQARAAFRQRLQMLDSLVTKLLLIEAARLPPHPFPDWRVAPSPGPMNTGGAEKAAATRSAAPVFIGPELAAARRPGKTEHPDHPQTWRVRFHVRIPKQSRATTLTRRTNTRLAPELIRAAAQARRLARRFEALRRVLSDPRAAIAALARKLAALGVAAHAAARRIALWRPRAPHASIPHGHAMVAAYDACRRWACPRWPDTS